MKARSDPFVICKQEGRYIGWPTIARTAEGDLLAAFSGDRDLHVCPFGKTFTVRSLDDGRVLHMGNLMNVDRRRVVVEETSDEGQSWRIIAEAPIPHSIRPRVLCEPHVCQARDGRLIALFRWNPPDVETCGLWQAESRDGGRTWGEPGPTTMRGYPPHLLRLGDGRMLASYGHRRAPYGQMACLRRDGGGTWDLANEIMICDGPNRDLGYPASVELRDGRILTVFYQIDQPGEKPCLMGAIWAPDSGA